MDDLLGTHGRCPHCHALSLLDQGQSVGLMYEGSLYMVGGGVVHLIVQGVSVWMTHCHALSLLD